jgi:hypothetical protein
MASPSEKLAQSLEILHGLQNVNGDATIRAKDMTISYCVKDATGRPKTE